MKRIVVSLCTGIIVLSFSAVVFAAMPVNSNTASIAKQLILAEDEPAPTPPPAPDPTPAPAPEPEPK